MAGLVPAICVFDVIEKQAMDALDKRAQAAESSQSGPSHEANAH
jgi:hypothetical protein